MQPDIPATGRARRARRFAMTDRRIHITDTDMRQLRQFLQSARRTRRDQGEYLRALAAELDRAVVVSEATMPPGLVTMHSRVELVDLDTRQRETYTLVFPHEADVEDGRISVLAPIGTAILGYKAGDTLSWKVPSGMRRLKVLKVVREAHAHAGASP
jgi:regulator of nucleoside diphosphate kinase